MKTSLTVVVVLCWSGGVAVAQSGGRKLDGGLGPPGDPPERPRKEERQKARKKPPKDKKATPPKTVLLPGMGVHRAPKILRLAGKLTGKQVLVERRSLNDVEVTIPRRLAKRHLTREELTIVLASQSLFLVEWEHPKKGAVLVATDQRGWTPGPPEYKRVVRVHPRLFDAAWKTVEDEVKNRNAQLPSASVPYRAVPAPKVGKIFLWGPSRRGLGELASYSNGISNAEKSKRPVLYSYRGRFRKVGSLVEPLREKLTEGERQRTRISVGAWQNTLFYRTPENIAKKIEGILEEIDREKPKRSDRKRTGRRSTGRIESTRSTGPRESSPEPARRTARKQLNPRGEKFKGMRVDLLEGDVPVVELCRFIADYRSMPVILDVDASTPRDDSVQIAAPMRNVNDTVAERLLESSGWLAETKTLPDDQVVTRVSYRGSGWSGIPEKRPIIKIE